MGNSNSKFIEREPNRHIRRHINRYSDRRSEVGPDQSNATVPINQRAYTKAMVMENEYYGHNSHYGYYNHREQRSPQVDDGSSVPSYHDSDGKVDGDEWKITWCSHGDTDCLGDYFKKDGQIFKWHHPEQEPHKLHPGERHVSFGHQEEHVFNSEDCVDGKVDLGFGPAMVPQLPGSGQIDYFVNTKESVI